MAIKIFKKWFCYGILCACLLNISFPAFAHGDDIAVGTQTTNTPIKLTPEQIKAIDLQTAKVSQKNISQTLKLNAQIQLLPNEQADVSSRISGQISAIYVNLGEQVQKNQPLVKVQSRLVGNPPPNVTLTAPMTGIVDARNVNLGQSVEPNTVLFHISNREQMLAIANVYEEDLGKIQVGQTANVEVLSFPNQLFSGKVTMISPNLNPQTRTINLWIVISNPQGLLRPDMYGHASIQLSQTNANLVVPSQAILDINGEQFVFLQHDGQFEKTLIKTGTVENNLTEIKSGLKLGDLVVIQGQRQLYTLWATGGKIQSHED